MTSSSHLLGALQGILPAIAANAANAEALRMTPPDNIALLKDIKFMRALQPKAWGGLELSLPEFAEAVATLAGACASTAWSTSLLSTHSHQLAQWRTNQAYAVKMCVAAVDRLFESSGANAWFLTNEAQRLFRDSHMTAAHAYTDYDVCKQIYGRHLVGLEPDPRLL